nr:hypothetical protein [Tanacetum cinerariifolium]
MNIYNMKLEQFQVKTKFFNTLPPEWSKFVTDVKLVRDLHTTNVDQFHAYLGQHEFHANEQGDDPIDAINHMMSFLSAVVTFFYPSTNNQLRNSSNPKKQATNNDERVTLQPVQGRQIYNCKGEGHISKQCTKPKRKRDDSWFKNKVLLFFYDHTTKQALDFQNPFYLKKAQQLEPKLYDGNVIKSTSAMVILDSRETLMLDEESR